MCESLTEITQRKDEGEKLRAVIVDRADERPNLGKGSWTERITPANRRNQGKALEWTGIAVIRA